MKNGDYAGAIVLFERVRPQLRYCLAHRPLTITLVSPPTATLQCIEGTDNLLQISGWKFDGLDIMVRQRLCEALYAAGRTKDAGESLLNLVSAIDEDVEPRWAFITEWVSGESIVFLMFFVHRIFSADFTCRYFSTPESNATRHDNPSVPPAPFNSPTSTALLRLWARATLPSCSWKNALVTASDVSNSFCCDVLWPDAYGLEFITPRFVTYQTICDFLEGIDRITDAAECFHQMVKELSVEVETDGDQMKWGLGEESRMSASGGHVTVLF